MPMHRRRRGAVTPAGDDREKGSRRDEPIRVRKTAAERVFVLEMGTAPPRLANPIIVTVVTGALEHSNETPRTRPSSSGVR
jgi:hypothetical protein